MPKTASDRVFDLHLAQRTRTTAKPSPKPIHESFRFQPWARGRLSALFLLVVLSLVAVDGRADDHGNSLSTATNVGLPSTTAGAIEFAGDDDYFGFTVTGTQTIKVITTGSANTAGSLMGPFGNILASNDDANGSLNFCIEKQLTSGAYYVRVRHSTSTATSGAYQLVISGNGAPTPPPTPVEDDHGNTFSTATTVSHPSTTAGAIHFAGDQDYFRFTVTGTQNIRVSTTGNTDTVGDVFDGNGTLLASNDDAILLVNFNFSIVRQFTAGTYYVRVRHYNAAATGGSYELEINGDAATAPVPVPTPVTDDHGNSLSTATSVNLPSTTAGAIQFAGDHDYFRFSVTATQVLTITTMGQTDNIGDIFDAGGALLASNGNASLGRNFYISLQLNAGIYYIRVRHSDPSATSGAYQLVLNGNGAPNPRPVADDYGNSDSTSAWISVPAVTNGSINYAGDRDCFRFTLTTSQALTVTTSGDMDTVGYIYDANGDRVNFNDNANGGKNFFIVDKFEAGTYYVHVSASDYNTGSSTGSYQLVINNQIADDHGNSILTATAISTASPFTGSINYAGDVDCFCFTVSAIMNINVYAYSSGSFTNMSLIDSNGVVINQNEAAFHPANQNGFTGFIACEINPGTYCIAVRHQNGSATSGIYNLRLSESQSAYAPSDDHSNVDVGATAISLPSVTDGLIEYKGDYDYFRFTLSRSHNISVSTRGTTDTYGELFDSNGALLASNNDTNGGINFSIARQLNSGTYYIRVRHNSENAYNVSYQMVLSGSLTSAPAPPVTDDHGNQNAATVVSVPSATAGSINYANDSDWFRFSLASSQRVTVCTTGSTDTTGVLYKLDGILLATSDNSNGSVNFSITRQLNAGVYLVRVSHRDSVAASGAYQMAVSTSQTMSRLPNSPNPVLFVTGNGNVIDCNDTTPAILDNTDFGESLFLGHFLERDFMIYNRGGAPLVLTGNPAVRLTWVDNPIITSEHFIVVAQPSHVIAPGGSTRFRLRYTSRYAHPDLKNLAAIRVDSNVGAFNCCIQAKSPTRADGVSNSFGAAMNLTQLLNLNVGSHFNGGTAIEYEGDVDVYTFTIPPPLSRRLCVSTEAITTTTDTVGALYNSQQVQIATDDDGNGNGQFKLDRILAPGTYYLSISAKSGSILPGTSFRIWYMYE